MQDSIFVRVQRVVSAGVGGAVGAAERVSGTSLMREAIREVDRAIARTRDQQDAAKTRRLQAEHQQKLVRKQVATLDEQARFAMGRNREDLAEAAIGRQIALEAQLKELTQIQSEASAEDGRLEENLAALKLRRSQMEEDLSSFEGARRAAANSDEAPGFHLRTERRVERAEEAFERAMKAAGGVAKGRTAPEAAARVAEIDALQSQAAVAERLAALRDAPAARAGAGAKKGRPGRNQARS